MTTTDQQTLDLEIRRVLAEHGRLATRLELLSAGDDLYQAGMTSHANVNVMLALEDAFDIEFPERLLQKRTFASIAAITDAVAQILTDVG